MEYFVYLVDYLRICKTDHVIPQSFEDSFPFLICFDLVLVNFAIDFNHQPGPQANKINNKPVHRMLAVKPVPA